MKMVMVRSPLMPILLLLLSNRVEICCSTNERLFVSVNGPLINTRLDPLVNPNTCAGHVHSVFGSSAFSNQIAKRDITDKDWQDDTLKFDQTTSNVIPNLSIYWAPSLYIRNPDDLLYYIVPTFSRAYYRIRHANDRTEINPFPLFLRLIAGNAGRFTEWDPNDPSEDGHDDIRWTTRSNRQSTNYQEHGDWGYLRDYTMAEIGSMLQLEMNINFPNCLALKSNGKPRTRSGNFRNHASYSDPNDILSCPPDFPYRIPTLNLEVRYDLKAMRQHVNFTNDDIVNDMDNWYLATGDTSGAGAHADFISGWPEDMFQDMLDFCDDGKDMAGAATNSCPVAKYGNLTRDEMNTKTIPFYNDIPDEVVSPVASLPSGDTCPPWTQL